jgi:hypothetical protein
MSLRKYLTSKVFFAQMLFAMGVVGALAFLFFNSLNYITNHGQEIAIPDLSKLSVEQADEKLSDISLDYIILDTVDYNPDFPKLTIDDQEPKPGSKVKAGRKVYIKINAETFVCTPSIRIGLPCSLRIHIPLQRIQTVFPFL